MKPEFTTKPLRELVEAFHDGSILLPQFQRDYVWRPQKIRNLLDSLLRGFPVGGFYLWRPSGGRLDPKPKAFGDLPSTGEFRGYLIDGQQRLTSLEAAFGLYTGEDKRGAELRCYLDLLAPEAERRRDTRLFVTYAGHRGVRRRIERGDSTLVPLAELQHGASRELLQRMTEALKARTGFKASDVEAALDRLQRAGAMLEQLVPVTTIANVSDKDAVEVFSRLNKGGTRLREGDVRAAELARGPAVDVLRQMRVFVQEARPRRLGFGFSFAFRTLVVFHRQTAQFTSLKPEWIETPGPSGRTLLQSWKAAEVALNLALQFADTTMGWSRHALIPSANALIVLAVAIDKDIQGREPGREQAFRRWLVLTALRGVFQGSVETTINRFCRAVRETRRGAGQALLEALKRKEAEPVHPEEFDVYAQLWGSATQVLHALFVSRGATDWLTGQSIDSLARDGAAQLPGGDLTVHHIFPRSVLESEWEDSDVPNCPANYALIGRATNAELGDRPPDEVLAGFTVEQRERGAVQYFGEDAGDRLRKGRYEEYCAWRAKRLASALNDWLGLPSR